MTWFPLLLNANIVGNAKIQGMSEELNMEGSDYNMALFMFFIPVSLA